MIAIYEPLYMPEQKLTEPAFRPLRLENNSHAEWREFHIIVDMYRRGMHRKQRFTGLLSPKFGLKTGITGSQFIEFVNANADADVCFINPFPQLAYISYNVWMQGEMAHAGLVSRAQKLLDASGIEFSIADVPRHGPDILCYCNFWAGSEKFWDDYVGGFLLPIAELLEMYPDSEASRAVLDETLHTDPSPFLPFIIERLFSSYLSLPRNRGQYRAYSIDPLSQCLTNFERDIVKSWRLKIDAADRRGVFSETLQDNMALICRLWHQYLTVYFSNRPHPHSGIPIRPIQAASD